MFYVDNKENDLKKKKQKRKEEEKWTYLFNINDRFITWPDQILFRKYYRKYRSRRGDHFFSSLSKFDFEELENHCSNDLSKEKGTLSKIQKRSFSKVHLFFSS